MRNPVPTQTQSPLPSPVVINTPSPRLIGNPCPAHERIPDPSSIIIRPPILIIDRGNPDIAIGLFIPPPSAVSQLNFIILEFRGKVSSGDGTLIE
jgi:hypothetical protein